MFKIIELVLDEEQDDIGVDAISIVESPAIESDFVALKNQKPFHQGEISEEFHDILKNPVELEIQSQSFVLTDNFAPIDHLVGG